jgi:hypothetical protein
MKFVGSKGHSQFWRTRKNFAKSGLLDALAVQFCLQKHYVFLTRDGCAPRHVQHRFAELPRNWPHIGPGLEAAAQMSTASPPNLKGSTGIVAPFGGLSKMPIRPNIAVVCSRCGGRSLQHDAKIRMGAVISCDSCRSPITVDQETSPVAVRKASAVARRYRLTA